MHYLFALIWLSHIVPRPQIAKERYEIYSRKAQSTRAKIEY